MLKAAAEKGWVNEKDVALEVRVHTYLTSGAPRAMNGRHVRDSHTYTPCQCGGQCTPCPGLTYPATYPMSGTRIAIFLCRVRYSPSRGVTMLHTLLCFKRAGADAILTYYAKQAARWLNEY
eukprot:1924214-Rhodomonas_salina.9